MGPYRLFLFALCLATALNPLNSSMIAVTLVAFREDFDLSVAAVSWVITAFYIASAAIQPLLGQVADEHGPRRILLVGMAIVVVGCLVAAAATSWFMLCLGRVVSACGTSAAFPAAIALIGRDAPARTHVSMLARIQLSGSLAVAVGPVVGGLLLAAGGWRAVFLVSIPLAGLAAAAVLISVNTDPRPPNRRATHFARDLDVRGVVLMTLALTTTVLTLQAATWFSRALYATILLASSVALVRTERRHPRPAVDFRVLSDNPALARVYGAWLLLCTFYYTVLYGLPQLLEDLGRLPHTSIGLALAPLAVTSVAITPFIVWAFRRRTPSKVLKIGTGFSVLVCVTSLAAGEWPTFWVGALIGCALGLTNGAVTLATNQQIFDATPTGQAGTSAAMFQSLRYAGAIASTCVLGFAFQQQATPQGWAVAIFICTAACIAALVLTAANSNNAT